ncbi:MAG: hypothetical protein [Caudoviricetes sp.]|nr:MAG: hypothetical protein [Caudoviricetes sp.]
MNNLETILKNVRQADGGATIDKNGNFATGQYYASIYPQYSFIVDNANDVTAKTIQNYVKQVNKLSGGILDKANNYIGLWNNPENNKIYFDISKSFNNKKAVKKACLEHAQIAYFDSASGKSVKVA